MAKWQSGKVTITKKRYLLKRVDIVSSFCDIENIKPHTFIPY